MLQKIEVAVPSILDKPLTYIWPFAELPKVGQLVEVPLKSKVTLGVVWNTEVEQVDTNYAIKEAVNSYQVYLPEAFVNFLKKFADYTCTALGVLVKHILPKELALPEIVSAKYVYNASKLTAEQAAASDAILKTFGNFHISLLDGVTGSGKTEIYLEASAKAYEMGQQVLILLPEIALTAQFCQRFIERFGQKPLIWHSQITPKQRSQIWHQAHKGTPCIVFGARSALLLPFSNLGLLVVDEEHDSSYKQDEVILYHARDMAILRAHVENIPAILVSATPSLETIYNAMQGKYTHLKVESRYGNASMPTVNILSMRGLKKATLASQWLHPILFKEIQNRLNCGEQTLLFLNRRGFAPLTVCGSCGFKITCKSCDVALVQHRNQPRLHCHYCNFVQPIPETCPECNQHDLTACGPGVERLSEDLTKVLPNARILSVTSDLVNTPKRTQEMVDGILNNQYDIIVGTQMLSKGYHFPNITLVGVVDADMGLSGPDLRCAERTYQQLHQVSGRCGREQKPGTVYMQTFDPEHLVIQAVASWDQENFVTLELEDREIHGMPPFGRLSSLVLSGSDNTEVLSFCRRLLNSAPKHSSIMIMGPVPAPLARIKNQFRWRFLLKYPKGFAIQQFIRCWFNGISKPSNIRLIVDIDPLAFH